MFKSIGKKIVIKLEYYKSSKNYGHEYKQGLSEYCQWCTM